MLSQEYLKNPRMSQSKLKRILDGVEEYKYNLENPTPNSEAMQLGSAVHILLLQPELKDRLIDCGDDFPGKTSNFGKYILYLASGNRMPSKDISEFNITKKDLEYLEKLKIKYPNAFEKPTEYFLFGSDLYQEAQAMADSVRQNTDAMQILNCCESFEQEHYFDYSDIPFKAQTDGLGSNFVLDLKTTRCENKEYKIKREIQDQGYHFQAATYLQATGKTNYYIIFVRSEAPYGVFPVKLSQEMIDEGRYLLDDACKAYKNCLKNNPEFKANNRLRTI